MNKGKAPGIGFLGPYLVSSDNMLSETEGVSVQPSRRQKNGRSN